MFNSYLSPNRSKRYTSRALATLAAVGLLSWAASASAQEAKPPSVTDCEEWWETPLQKAYDTALDEMKVDSIFWRKVKLSGSLAQSYTYNFARPGDNINSFRAFDRKHDRYMLNQLQLAILAESTTESRFGFGFKGNAGLDTEVFTPFEEATSDKVDIYEVWVSYLVTDDILVKAGKMSTLAGFEVADEKDNYNISRGLLWSLLQPVTHTGVRATYTDPDKAYDFTVGVNRGWDTFRHDNNDSLSFETRLGINATEKLSYAVTLLHGPETLDDSHRDRTLLDLVATYKATDKLTLGANYDFRWDEGGTADSDTASAHGLAAYAKYDFTEKFSLAGRLEAVRDHGAAATGSEQTIGNATLTAQYKFRKNLIGRMELRHDHSNESVFTRRDTVGKSQTSVAASVLITF